MKHTCHRLLVLSALVYGAILLAGVSLSAQDTQQPMLTDQRMVVIPARSMSEIAADIDDANRTKQLAVDRKTQSENRLREIENAIETRKVSLKDTDRKKDDAKKAKRESELIALQIEAKANQQAIDLLNKLKDLRKAEIEEAETETKLSDVEVQVYQLENELQVKRIQYDSLTAAGASDLTRTTAQQVLRELEVRLLKLQNEQAAATQKVASKQKDIVARRMKLHEAQLKLGMPRA